MNITLWIVASVTAFAFLASGFVKIAYSRAKLLDQGYSWVEDFSTGQVKLLGLLELLGAVGLVLPPAVGRQEVLSPIASTGLALFMVGAIVVHVRRGEASHLGMPVALTAITVLLAALRFGPYSF